MVPLYNSGGQEIIDKLQTNFDTSVVTKIAAKAVNVQLRRYVREHNLLSPVQSFFFPITQNLLQLPISVIQSDELWTRWIPDRSSTVLFKRPSTS